MTAYYNEIDPFAAQWLRNLINAGHIAPGIVDERSIEDVYPSDLRGFTQCHFFAGIGVWSHALRSAGWSDDRPVWTGSCPCQPFSAAGKGAGFDDERHLWPAFNHLIKECQPAIVLGEQVASKDADPWIDLVCNDLEAMGYAFGAVPFPSAGVGAPHIRDRLYWVAYASGERVRAEGLAAPGATAQGMCGTDGQRERLWVDAGASSTNGADRMADAADQRQHGRWSGQACDGRYAPRIEPERLCDVGWLGHAGYDHDAGQEPTTSAGQPKADRPADQPSGSSPPSCGLADAESERRAGQLLRAGTGLPSDGVAQDRDFGWLADAQHDGRDRQAGSAPVADSNESRQRLFDGDSAAGGLADHLMQQRPDGEPGICLVDDAGGRLESSAAATGLCGDLRPSPTNGFWANADWLFCRDGKWRPVEPGTFPLVNGAPARVGRLRAYGNAINAKAAQAFIECVM